MKLKILPPTLREKKRYIGIKIYSQEKIEKNEIVYLLWNSIINTYGEIEASHVNLWLIEIKEMPNNKRYQYNAIIKCQRGYEDKTITALNTITRYKKIPVVVHSIGTSGTIKSLNNKFNLL